MVVAVVNEVDSRVDALVFDAAKLRNIAMPLGGIVADEIAALARERLRGLDAGGGTGSFEMHADQAGGGGLILGGGPLEIEHGLIGGEKQAVAHTTSQVFDLGVGLALVRLEVERQRHGSGGNRCMSGGQLGGLAETSGGREAENDAGDGQQDDGEQRGPHPPICL